MFKLYKNIVCREMVFLQNEREREIYFIRIVSYTTIILADVSRSLQNSRFSRMSTHMSLQTSGSRIRALFTGKCFFFLQNEFSYESSDLRYENKNKSIVYM